LRGVAIFAKACFGHPSPSKRQKLNATAKAFGIFGTDQKTNQKTNKIHYFEYIVKEFLPNVDENVDTTGDPRL
jgi:hypothetical protein